MRAARWTSSPDVALVGQKRRSGVQADPDLHLPGCERTREGGGGHERSRRGREREEEGVTLRVDLDAALVGAGLADDAAVLGERIGVRLGAELVQQLRRALDVGEEKGDGAGRKVVAHGAIIRPTRGRVQSRLTPARGSPAARVFGNVA